MRYDRCRVGTQLVLILTQNDGHEKMMDMKGDDEFLRAILIIKIHTLCQYICSS